MIKCCCFKADGLYNFNYVSEKDSQACGRHACKLEVRSILTYQKVEVTQVLLDSFDECRVNLAPALMSSPAAASLKLLLCVTTAPASRLQA